MDIQTQNMITTGETQLIDTAKNGIKWNDSVDFVPAYTRMGNLAGHAVEATNPNGQTEVLGNVGANYLLLDNRDLVSEVEYYLGSSATPSRIFWDGAKFAAIYPINETRPSYDASGNERNLKLSVLVKNSYNGSWKAEVSLMILDGFCMNGMVLGKRFGTVRFSHRSSNSHWKEEIMNNLGHLIDNAAHNHLPDFADKVTWLSSVKVETDHLRHLFGEHSTTKIGNALAGTIVQRWVDSEEDTLHGLFSAGTNVLWHNDKKSFTSRNFDMNEGFVNAVMAIADRA